MCKFLGANGGTEPPESGDRMTGSEGRRAYGDGALFYKESRALWMVRLDLGWGADGKRKRWEATSRTREGALNKLRKARTDIATLGTIPTSAMTTQAWLEPRLEDIVRPHVKPGTFSDYRQAVSKHLIPRIGKAPIATLSPTHVRTMYKAVIAESSLGNANKVHRVLRAALTSADARLIIQRSASAPAGSRRATALLTGARQGEVLGLQWDRVDLDAATIDITWQLQQQHWRHGCGGTCRFKTAAACPSRELDVPPRFEYIQLVGAACLTRPKSTRSTREIAVPQLLVQSLRKHRLASIKRTNPPGMVSTNDQRNPIEAPPEACEPRVHTRTKTDSGQ